MILASFVSLLLLSSQSPSTCESVEVCRAHALIAHAKGDFEAFHDFAWAASRKGKANDPESMLLIARAQSLSGRPGDALVMLERVAAVGKLPSDLDADPDFARVRGLPRWQEVGPSLLANATGEPASPPKPEALPESPKAEPPRTEVPKPSPRPESSKPAAPKPAPPPADPKAAPPAVSKAGPPPVATAPPAAAAAVAPPKPEEASRAAATPEPAAPAVPPRAPGVPLKFTTMLSPTALAYDRVSKRYIIADRQARRIAVVDENSGQVSTLAGAMAGLADVEGIAIDASQGDLWVVTSGEEGLSLSKMQLISGRVLSTTRLQGVTSSVVAMTFVPAAGLIIADGDGVLWAVRTTGRAERLTSLEYVPRALGSDTRGRLYVSAGGPRLARFALGPFRRLGTVELSTGSAPDGPFVVAADRLETIAATTDGYELRTSTMK